VSLSFFTIILSLLLSIQLDEYKEEARAAEARENADEGERAQPRFPFYD
jgi:hypothetical protein